MASSEFSERHYELAINLELISGINEYYVPSQNEEATLGYDVALVPNLPYVLEYLTHGRRGVKSPGGSGPVSAVSLFLQYKRPHFISNRNGKETEERSLKGAMPPVPYYRITLQPEQLEALLALEEEVGEEAAVCYAAAKFHLSSDFYSYKSRLDVASNSIFLSVKQVREDLYELGWTPSTPLGKHCWTYDPGGGDGVLCSEPRRLEGETFERLRGRLREAVAEAKPAREHVDLLSTRISGWRERFEEKARREELPARFEDGVPIYEPWALTDDLDPELRTRQFLDQLGIGWFLAVPMRQAEEV